MKKYFYAIMMVAGLAFVLAGCTDSGGSYWPATPVSPVTGTQVQPLSGNNVTGALFNVPAGGGNPLAVQNINTGLVAGCPILGLNTGTGVGQVFGAVKTLAGVRAAGVSKKKTEVTGVTVSDSDTSASKQSDNFYRFTYSYKTTVYLSTSSDSGSSSGINCSVLPNYGYDSFSSNAVTKTYSWDLYVHLVSSSGAEIPITSDSTTWFSYATDPDKVHFYGKYSMKMEGTGYDWTELTTFGDATNYWKIENLQASSTTSPQKIMGTSTTTSGGTLNNETASSFSYSYTISDGSTGFFTQPTSGAPTGVIKFGNSSLFVTITFDGTSKAMISYSPSAPAGAPTSLTL